MQKLLIKCISYSVISKRIPVVSPKFYTARKNFTGPLVPTVPTNFKSATNIFLLWYNLTCFFKSHFSRNLSSQISNAVCYGIFSYASSSRLRKILSRKMIQLRNLCSPSLPMSPWSWRSPWSIMCLQWQQRFSHY